ncbi:FecR family protein [Niabella beijingensis]|uniref:FecR family protein n=1 Tax=Niabella beijingensis TaxID=2872700 RepID=UPI001CBBA187|nr:FecR family protein [Niabella beijingensis]MBZ4192151.1 DUF4974 domain-containing protein [Niabella beijingensis]
MLKSRIEELLQLLADGTATTAETDELYGYYLSAEHAAAIEALIDTCWDRLAFEKFLTVKESERLYRHIQRRLPQHQVKKIAPGWWIAAAAVLLVLAVGGLLPSSRSGKKQQALVPVITDVAPPAAANAVLFLENGDKQLLKASRAVRSSTISRPANAKGYNTIFNPRGSQPIEIVLADSTRLWLNAESSVKYPLQFAAAERRVQVSGEAYFEVAHQENKPFVVENGKTEVKVLGTHFNINTFDNKIKVTLLQGLVQVSNQKDSNLINPGQAAVITEAVDIMKSDTVSAVAWKSQLFDFKETALDEILQEIGRWYDVEVFYEGPVPKITLSGSVNRNINASKVLEMLALTSGLQFEIKGRRIIVSKNK